VFIESGVLLGIKTSKNGSQNGTVRKYVLVPLVKGPRMLGIILLFIVNSIGSRDIMLLGGLSMFINVSIKLIGILFMSLLSKLGCLEGC
jgi:Flp pilus assembly protein protease CpaA